jgi:hypothetical protein
MMFVGSMSDKEAAMSRIGEIETWDLPIDLNYPPTVVYQACDECEGPRPVRPWGMMSPCPHCGAPDPGIAEYVADLFEDARKRGFPVATRG